MCMHTSGKSHHVGVVTSVAGRLAVKLACQLIAQLRRVNNGDKMFLYRYYRPADGVLDSKGPLSRTIPPAVLSEVNKESEACRRQPHKEEGFISPYDQRRRQEWRNMGASMEFGRPYDNLAASLLARRHLLWSPVTVDRSASGRHEN